VRRLTIEAVALLALAAALVAGGSAASTAAPAQRRVSVFFVRGEQLAPTTRVGSTPVDAVRALFAGTTRAERRRGFRTYIPAGTEIHGVAVENGLATVDVSARFVSGRAAPNLLARLAQVVRTLTGLDGTTRVQLLVDGAKVSGVFPHIPTERPITFALLQTPDVPVPKPPPGRRTAPDRRVKQAQQLLIALGYCLRAPPTGASGLSRKRPSSPFRSGSGSAARACSTAPRSRVCLLRSTRSRSHAVQPASARRSCSTARSGS
jgi:Sporulation and spore germination